MKQDNLSLEELQDAIHVGGQPKEVTDSNGKVFVDGKAQNKVVVAFKDDKHIKLLQSYKCKSRT